MGQSSEQSEPGYWGQPFLKAPVWSWEIPLYFFIGGLGGAAAIMALAGRLFRAPGGVVLAAGLVAMGAALVSPLLLALDLGRPLRFLYMLRVFKWRSPMSVGSFLLTFFGAFAIPAGLLLILEWFLHGPVALGVIVTLLLVGAALFGAGLATYTGTLIAATAVPAWNHHKPVLPVHFASSGLGSAAGLLELMGFLLAPLNVLGYVASVMETLVGVAVEVRREGRIDAPLHSGWTGWAIRLSGLAAGPLALVLRILDLRIAAAIAFLLGALVSRYIWLWVGRTSALDPTALFAAEERSRRGPADLRQAVQARLTPVDRPT